MTGLGLKSLVKNSATTLGRQVLAGFIQLITFAIIARVFGPEGNGQYAVALLLPIFLVTFLNMGVGPANVYHLGAGKVGMLTALRVSMSLWLIITILGMLVGAAVIRFYAELFFPGIDAKLLWLSLIAFPVCLLQDFIISVFQGVQRFSEFNFVLLVQPLVSLIMIVIGVLAGAQEVEYVIISYIAGVFSAIMVSLYFLTVKKVDYIELQDQDDAGYSRSAINYGYKSNLSNILAFINYKADIFLVNYLLGASAAGIYIVAVHIVERLWLLSQSVSTILLPRLSQLNSDEKKRKQMTPIICRWVLTLTLMSGVLLGMLSYPLIGMLFGDSYLGAVMPLLFLLPGILAGSGARILANDIAARGRPELNMYTAWVVVIVNIVGNLILIPSYGLVGAATATSLSYTLNLFLKLYIYSYFTDHKWSNLLLIKNDDFRMILMLAKR